MTENIVVMQGGVMPGKAGFDLEKLQRVAKQFGWTVGTAGDLNEVVAAQARRRTTAVLFHYDALGSGSWLEAVRLLKFALPDARLVACPEFRDSIDWPVLCDAGVFHSLWLPLKEEEVRRSFGFIWEAMTRETGSEAMDSEKSQMGKHDLLLHGLDTAVAACPFFG